MCGEQHFRTSNTWQQEQCCRSCSLKATVYETLLFAAGCARFKLVKVPALLPKHQTCMYGTCFVAGEIKLYCNRCRDDSRKKCRSCSCNICGLKTDINRIIICEECQKAFHIFCLTPRLTEIPADEWYCFNCKTNDLEIVKPGEKPFKNQYLGNPMVPVGTCWETRTQVEFVRNLLSPRFRLLLLVLNTSSL